MMPPTIDHIIQQYGERLHAICRGYAHDDPGADDLYQDVLVTVWRRLDTFRGEARLSTWLYRVAVNTCLMHRRRRRLPTVEIDRAAETAPAPPAGEDEALLRLRAAVRQLPQRDRILILLYLEDLSYEEIGAVTGDSVSNVGVRLHRIRKSLTQLVTTPESWNP